MTEPLAKIGRGGAGNHWSLKDIEDAEEAARHDEEVEAQNQHALRLVRNAIPQSEYAKVGRGGAGNVVRATEAEALGSELDRVTTPKTLTGIVSAAHKAPQVYHGHAGRGGAGNWRGNAEEEERKLRDAEEERVRKGVESRVQAEVQQLLKAPEKTYRAPREEEKVGK